MKAVVTAGGTIDGEYAELAGTNVKALVKFDGVTMLERVVAALRGAGATRVAVVGGAQVGQACAGSVERIVGDGGSGSANLVRALRAWPEDGDTLLYATSDMPYVSAESVAAFLARAPQGRIAMPLARYDAFFERFPGSPAAGITLAGERVVNGDVFVIPAGYAARIEGVASRLFEARKAPWKMARLISPVMLLRFALRRLSIADLEAYAKRVLALPVAAVRDAPPELAFDADTVEDYRYAANHR